MSLALGSVAAMVRMSRDWKQFWAEQTDPHHPRCPEFFLAHGREFALVCGDLAGKRVLELGCGSGELFDSMGLRQAASYRGVDFSEAMLGVFRAAHPHADLICAEASGYVDTNQYDLIFSSSLVQYFTRGMFERHVANARAMLAPGGRLLIGSLPWRGARAAFHLQAWSQPGRRGLMRRLLILALSHLGVDRMGRWYTYRECLEAAQRHALKPTFFGCLQMPYRFHVTMDAVPRI